MNTQRASNFRKVIFLFGPTAVGKTDLLCSLFASGFEVVNADSVQVYKFLDIGSAKADKRTLAVLPHHLIDILEPCEKFNTADFIRLADDACTQIEKNGNVPILCGGTAYYFKNFLYGLSEAPQCDPFVRREVANLIEQIGLEKAYDYLYEVDPISANRIHRNDAYRISRALEVYKQCGKPLSSFIVPNKPRNSMNVLILGLQREKSELKERIRLRVDMMFQNGLCDEICKLVKMGANSSWQSMQGIGYSEFFREFDKIHGNEIPINLSQSEIFKNIDPEQIKEQIVMDSIHYAKRQMTFFKSFPNVNWISPDDRAAISDSVYKFLH